MPTTIHLGNADKARLECGAKAKTGKPSENRANWTWVPEIVTCKKCLSMYRRRLDARSQAEEADNES